MDLRKKILLAILFSTQLSSCVNATITGAQAFYDRRNIQKNLNDQYIAYRADRSIYIDNKQFKNTHVNVASFNGVVLLAGQVQEPSQRDEIEQLVRKVSGIKELHNVVTVASPTSALTQISDTWITTKVKTKLIAMNDIDPSQIKVVTEDGTVYLMGIVPPDQADIAVDIARTTDGVQRVVKIFDYVRISKT